MSKELFSDGSETRCMQISEHGRYIIPTGPTYRSVQICDGILTVTQRRNWHNVDGEGREKPGGHSCTVQELLAFRGVLASVRELAFCG